MKRAGFLSILALSVVSAAFGADVPRPAGPLRFVSSTGETVQISDLKGKVVVVEFLLTHCPTCQASARLLSKLQTELGPKGLQVVGIAIDEGAGPKLPDFIAKTGANFPVGVLPQNGAYDFLQIPIMVRLNMPQLAFVDRKGQVREQHGAEEPWMMQTVEESNIRALLTKLLAEKAPAKAAPAKAAPKK